MTNVSITGQASLLERRTIDLSLEKGGTEEGAIMFGYGLLGTLLVICLIVWIIKKL
jgi:hypothetical protein